MKGIQLCIFAIVCVCWPHHTIYVLYTNKLGVNYLTAYHAPTSYEYLTVELIDYTFCD